MSSPTVTAVEPSPVSAPTTTASTNSASVSVMTVPETAMPTAGWPARPSLRTIGYATSVCDAHIDP